MIKATNLLKGKISSSQNLKGKTNIGIQKLYPELEDLFIRPSSEQQIFKSEKYGYDEVTIEAVDLEEKEVTPSNTDQEVISDTKTGLSKVIVKGDENLKADNIVSGTSIFGVEGTAEKSFDLSLIRQTRSMFSNNSDLIEAPFFNTSTVTNMSYMFQKCTNLIYIPNYNTNKVTSMDYMFSYCYMLESIPALDTSNVTNMYRMFEYCRKLQIAPLFNTSKVTKFSSMFSNCDKLKEIPQYDTSKAKEMDYMFGYCTELKDIPLLDCSGPLAYIRGIFQGCSKLENVGGLKDLGISYTTKSENYYNYVLSLSDSKLLTHESLMNIINNLYDLNLSYKVAEGGTLYRQQLYLGPINKPKLTEEEIQIAINKGWNVT